MWAEFKCIQSCGIEFFFFKLHREGWREKIKEEKKLAKKVERSTEKRKQIILNP